MGEKKLDGAGLRGQVAGKTALSTVGKEGKGLTSVSYTHLPLPTTPYV